MEGESRAEERKKERDQEGPGEELRVSESKLIIIPPFRMNRSTYLYSVLAASTSLISPASYITGRATTNVTY